MLRQPFLSEGFRGSGPRLPSTTAVPPLTLERASSSSSLFVEVFVFGARSIYDGFD